MRGEMKDAIAAARRKSFDDTDIKKKQGRADEGGGKQRYEISPCQDDIVFHRDNVLYFTRTVKTVA